MALIIILFIGLIFIGLPVAFVLAISGMVYMIVTGAPFGMMTVQTMISTIDSFVFLCIPFFLLTGEIMNAAGITRRLIQLSQYLVGGIRGSLAYVNIIVSMFFAGMTGSATADTSAIGSILIPGMKEEGYKPPFACAVTAMSSVIGPIIPPSIPMVILGLVVSISIGKLFLAGAVAGVLLGFSLMGVVFMGRHKYPKSDVKRPGFWSVVKVFLTTLPALMTPVIILGGLISGVFTPTEASAIAVAWSLICALFIYRGLKFRDLPRLFLRAGIMTGAILILLSAAGVLGWALTIEQLPHRLANLLLSIAPNKYILLMLINILILFMGTFMDPAIIIIIMAPVLLPAIVTAGVDPLHFGMILVLNCMIGLTTPPLGVCLFVASTIGGVPVEKIVRAILPFLAASIIVLLLITYIPWLTLWLPNMVFG